MSLKLPGPESERKENTIKNEKLSQSEKTDFLASEMASNFIDQNLGHFSSPIIR